MQSNGWSLAAILPYLEVLNGASVTMEHHVLANKKHGSVDDQRRLALRLYDEAFMAAAVRGLAQWCGLCASTAANRLVS